VCLARSLRACEARLINLAKLPLPGVGVWEASPQHALHFFYLPSDLFSHTHTRLSTNHGDRPCCQPRRGPPGVLRRWHHICVRSGVAASAPVWSRAEETQGERRMRRENFARLPGKRGASKRAPLPSCSRPLLSRPPRHTPAAPTPVSLPRRHALYLSEKADLAWAGLRGLPPPPRVGRGGREEKKTQASG